MIKLALLFLAIITQACLGQNKVTPTDEFSIVGQIQKEIKFTLSDLGKLKPTGIGDVVITNHLGEKKGTASNLSGIPIKDIFKDVQFNAESPKQLSEYYFIFVASDNYKVVYSWNEIFNSLTGDNIYLIVEKDGKKLNEMDDRILILTKTDYKTGRRFIKNLSKIMVQRVP